LRDGLKARSAVQRSHDADAREHRWPPRVATKIRAPIALFDEPTAWPVTEWTALACRADVSMRGAVHAEAI
jgi:hypothetical protein